MASPTERTLRKLRAAGNRIEVWGWVKRKRHSGQAIWTATQRIVTLGDLA